MTLHSGRIADPKRYLAGYSFLTCAVTLALVYAGGFTTTIGAGMVFPDWPLSNGSLNPPGWTTDQAMLAEHSHRLMGIVVGILCIGLCVWMYLREARGWLRYLSYGALGLVIFQGILGGMRVLFESLNLAQIHGVTAQIFLCTLVSIAVGSSYWWSRIEVSSGEEKSPALFKFHRWAGAIVCLLIMVQLVVGAIMRHRGAGLAIPYFPYASPDGGFLPISWNWATLIHFGHRALALVIYILFLGWLFQLRKARGVPGVAMKFGMIGFFLIHIQILLGAGIIWSGRAPVETTLHVLNGALFLAFTWAMTFAFFKPLLEPPKVARVAATEASTREFPLINNRVPS